MELRKATRIDKLRIPKVNLSLDTVYSARGLGGGGGSPLWASKMFFYSRNLSLGRTFPAIDFFHEINGPGLRHGGNRGAAHQSFLVQGVKLLAARRAGSTACLPSSGRMIVYRRFFGLLARSLGQVAPGSLCFLGLCALMPRFI